ncbi:MAG: hypothetical protein AMK72_13730 [Planctomycetes bacterium SM23_25]|nr:MAG: hypothetical protein AMK72_13730 [Planctomycetes bacterium SM23_25]
MRQDLPSPESRTWSRAARAASGVHRFQTTTRPSGWTFSRSTCHQGLSSWLVWKPKPPFLMPSTPPAASDWVVKAPDDA